MNGGSFESTSKKKPRETLLAFRHMEDVDDIADGLDTELKPLTPESESALRKNAEAIISHAKLQGADKVMLVSSPRKRALDTSTHIQEFITSLDRDIQARVKEDERFAELNHGTFVLPENYVPGRRVEHLRLAWKVFWEQTFTSDGEYNNPNYKFGSPTGEGDSVDVELGKSFETPGESYRELTLRYYQGILEYLENNHKVRSAGFDVVLVAHSATLSILRELADIGTRFSQGDLKIQAGDLMKLCWKQYLSRSEEAHSNPAFGSSEVIELSEISESVTGILRKEIVFMSNPENYEK